MSLLEQFIRKKKKKDEKERRKHLGKKKMYQKVHGKIFFIIETLRKNINDLLMEKW